MGFFSAIKKFLGSDSKEDVKKEATEAAPEAASESAPEIVPEVVAEAEPEVAPEAVAEAEQDVPPQDVLEAEEALQPEQALEPELLQEPVDVPVPAVENASAVENAPEEQISSEAPLLEPVQTLDAVPDPIAEPIIEAIAEPIVELDAAQFDAHAQPPMDLPSAAPAPSTPSAAAPALSSFSGLSAEDQASLALALRTAEPRLSSWLAVVTEGISEVSPLLWQRLRYLLESLEAKESEAEAFVQDFKGWLERMEYEYVEEFRSELQYRLALALELEDEEDERNRLFVKLSDGLARTREQFTRKLDALFASHGAFDAAFWEEMEELLIMADVGFESSMELMERLKDGVRKRGLTDPQELREVLQDELTSIFQMQKRIVSFNAPEVIMMIGVNGVGKTTTIAKLAHRDRMQGKKVLIAAADTFRAAATEQLGVWAARVGADFHRKDAGADPAAVAFEAMDMALRGGYDVLYIDTAGRLQTKVNLMEELKKIRNVVAKKHQGAPHRSILVVDATTGQNALSQTKLFNEAAGIDEIILSKLDGTAKGGVAISVAMQFQIPITYVGLGEKLEDLRPFNGKDFALALLGVEKPSE